MKRLYETFVDFSEEEGTINNYFNLMYRDGEFLDSVNYITQKITYGNEGINCFFPDMNSCEEEEHFEGVQFLIGFDDEFLVTVSEESCFQYVKLACEQYLKKHPKDKIQINIYLSRVNLYVD